VSESTILATLWKRTLSSSERFSMRRRKMPPGLSIRPASGLALMAPTMRSLSVAR